MHETVRKSNENLLSDVYDTPRWKKIFGPPTQTLERIGVQLCVDGMTIHKRKELKSSKPMHYVILSLPPRVRYKSTYMLIHMLVPHHLKGQAVKKYYDHAAVEMNELHRDGVCGVKVKLYGVSLDTPGRRELLQMQSVTAFYPCPHCLHSAEPGLRGQVFGGFRRYLPIVSPWRQKFFFYKGQKYEFRNVEVRGPAPLRTDESVRMMIGMSRRDRRPFMGHKGEPLLSKWVGVDWESSMCDKMHDLKCFVEMLLKGLVGRGSHGMYKAWKRDVNHRNDCRAFGIFKDFQDGENPPWRLSKQAIRLLDMRVRNIWWPHYLERLCRDHHSFWTHSEPMYKSKHKSYILFVLLPTCLHGFVAAVHNAILMIVHALRQLDGYILSISESMAREVRPGSHVADKTKVAQWGHTLVRGLVLLEGSFPVSHLNPALHHLVHYGWQTARGGLLRWVAMWSFERNNKRMKRLVRNTGTRCESSLAGNLLPLLGYSLDRSIRSV